MKISDIDLECPAKIDLNFFKNTLCLHSLAFQENSDYFEYLPSILTKLLESSKYPNLSNDESKSIAYFGLLAVRLLYIKIYSQKSACVDFLTDEYLKNLHNLFIGDSESLYRICDDNFIKYIIASKWFLVSLCVIETLDRSEDQNLSDRILRFISSIQDQHYSVHLDLILCYLNVNQKNIDHAIVDDRSTNIDIGTLIDYIKSMTNEYAINDEIKHMIYFTNCKLLVNICEKCILPNKIIFQDVLSMIGECMKSAQASQYFNERLKELSNIRCFVTTSLSQFPFVDISVLEFLSNYISVSFCHELCVKTDNYLVDLNSMVYNLKISIDDTNFKSLKLIDNNTVVVKRSFNSQGQIFQKHLVGNILAKSDEELLISFKVNGTLNIFLSHICFKINKGQEIESILNLTAICVKLINCYHTSKIDIENIDSYKLILGQILIIVPLNTHSIVKHIHSKNIIREIYSIYSNFSSLHDIKHVLRNLFALPHNNITIFAILSMIINLDDSRGLDSKDIDYFITIALTSDEIFDMNDGRDICFLTELITNYTHLINESSDILELLLQNEKLISFLIDYSFMQSTLMNEQLKRFGLSDLNNENSIAYMLMSVQNCLKELFSRVFSDKNTLNFAMISKKYQYSDLLNSLVNIVEDVPLYNLKISSLELLSNCLLFNDIRKEFLENSNFKFARSQILFFIIDNLKTKESEELRRLCTIFLSNLLEKPEKDDIIKIMNDLRSQNNMEPTYLIELIMPSQNSVFINAFIKLLRIIGTKFPPQFLDWGSINKKFLTRFISFIRCDEKFNPESLLNLLNLFKLLRQFNDEVIIDLQKEILKDNLLIKFIGKIFVMAQEFQNMDSDSMTPLYSTFDDFMLIFIYEDIQTENHSQLVDILNKSLTMCSNILKKYHSISLYVQYVISITNFVVLNHKHIDVSEVFNKLIEYFELLLSNGFFEGERFCSFFSILLQKNLTLINQKQDKLLSVCDQITNCKITNKVYGSQYFNFMALMVCLLPPRAVSACASRFKLLNIIELSFIEILSRSKELINQNDRYIIRSIFLLMKSLVSHEIFLNKDNSSTIFRILMIPLDDFFNNNKDKELSQELLELSLYIIYLTANADMTEKYNQLANFIACHRQIIIFHLKNINFKLINSIRLCKLIANILENMLNSEYSKCKAEFNDIIICFESFPQSINSHIRQYISKDITSTKMTNLEKFELLELSISVVLLIKARTPDFIDLLSKNVFRMNDLFFFTVDDYSSKISIWMDLSQSFAFLASDVDDQAPIVDIFPHTKYCLEMMCLIMISQLYMIHKIIEQQSSESAKTIASDFYLHIKNLLIFLSSKYHKISPLKSPRRSFKTGINTALSLDPESIATIEKALNFAFRV